MTEQKNIKTDLHLYTGWPALLFLLPAILYFWSFAPPQASIALYLNLWALAVVDFQTFRLPNIFTGTLVITGLYVAWTFSPFQFSDHLIGLLIGALTPLLINITYRTLRGRDGIGMGDVKLLAGAGAWLSWQALPMVLLAASLSALLFAGVQRLCGTHMSAQTHIPFGPFICLGIWTSWLMA